MDTAPRRSKYLRAIEFVQHDEARALETLKIEETETEDIDIDLDLSDDIENQLVILRPTAAFLESEFKIEQQFETSFQVSDEGPHFDLRDWKHYRSRWRELKSMGGSMFLTRKISEAESQRFPNVTMQEIYRAVLSGVDTRWANMAQTCRTLTSDPCGVGVSTISFRISVKEKGRWKIINRINFAIPMGC